MSGNDILIQHGEKAAVALIALICVYVIWGTLNNEAIHPQSGPNGERVTSETIKATTKLVGDMASKGKAPSLKEPPNYLADMRRRITSPVTPGAYMLMVSAHPDAGPINPGESAFVYVYELHQPQIEVKDTVGSLELILTLPSSKRSNSKQLNDSERARWSRTVPKGKDGRSEVENRAEWLGVIIEMKSDGGNWEPLAVEGKITAGFVPLEATRESVPVPKVKSWTTYSFRARMLAKATGYHPFNQIPPADRTVLVCAGDIDPNPDSINWTQLAMRLRDNDATVTAKFLPGDIEAPITLQPSLTDKERLYRSEWSDEAKVTASSAVRMYLDKVSPDPQNPDALLAHMKLTLMMRDPKNNSPMWLKKTEDYKVGPTQELGDDTRTQDIPTDDPVALLKRIDLKTPYKLMAMDKGVKRILFYEVVAQSRAGGAKGKDLVLKEKDAMTDKAEFKNGVNGETKTFFKLVAIQRPAKAGEIFIYPDYPAGFNEEDEFNANPGEFIQPTLAPTKPRRWQNGEGPLAELLQKGNDLAQTDTPYYQFPDGRLVYYDNINKFLAGLQSPTAFVPETGETVRDDYRPGSGPEGAPMQTPAPAPASEPWNGILPEVPRGDAQGVQENPQASPDIRPSRDGQNPEP
jgi:hypothetical protein